jgi:hypothetical protein
MTCVLLFSIGDYKYRSNQRIPPQFYYKYNMTFNKVNQRFFDVQHEPLETLQP